MNLEDSVDEKILDDTTEQGKTQRILRDQTEQPLNLTFNKVSKQLTTQNDNTDNSHRNQFTIVIDTDTPLTQFFSNNISQENTNAGSRLRRHVLNKPRLLNEPEGHPTTSNRFDSHKICDTDETTVSENGEEVVSFTAKKTNRRIFGEEEVGKRAQTAIHALRYHSERFRPTGQEQSKVPQAHTPVCKWGKCSSDTRISQSQGQEPQRTWNAIAKEIHQRRLIQRESRNSQGSDEGVSIFYTKQSYDETYTCTKSHPATTYRNNTYLSIYYKYTYI